MRIRITFMCCCLWAAGLPAVAGAQPSTLSLDQALIRVLENHPRLKARDFEATAIAARLREAALSPPYEVQLSLEDFAGSGPASGVHGIEATLSLSRLWERGDKARLRGEVVGREAVLLRNQQDIDRLDLMAETARRFLHVAADQERLRLASTAIELIDLNAGAVEERIDAGLLPASERQRIAIDRADYELELDHFRHELESSRVTLAALWNARQADFDQIIADIYAVEPLPAFENLTALLERNPDLIRHLRAEDLAQARVRLAASRRRTDVRISSGVRFLGGSDDVALVLSASIPLGAAPRARPAIEEAEALARIDPLNLEATRLELHATLFALCQESQHSSDAVDTLRRRIIPAAEEMLTAADAGYRAGRYSLLELTLARQRVLEARTRALEQAAAYHGFRIEIDRLTGTVPGSQR